MTVRLLPAAALLFALTACQTCPAPVPKIVVETQRVPTPVPCQPNLPPQPAYADAPDALRGTTDLYERVKLLLLGRSQRAAREEVLNAALTQCAAPIPSATDAAGAH